MPDSDLVKALSFVKAEMFKITVIFLIVVILVCVISRVLIYIFVEKGKLNKIREKINKSKFFKTACRIFNPDIENLRLQEDCREENSVTVTRLSSGGQSVVKYKDDEIQFGGARGLMLSYFYQNKNKKISYHNFNAWLINNGYPATDSRVFRQEIFEINGRLEKESKYISSIITPIDNEPNNKIKMNLYQYRVKFQNNSDYSTEC